MPKKTIIVTGGDEKFYPFMMEALKSITALKLDAQADIGVLDLGLNAQQISSLQSFGCAVKKPRWTLSVPETIQMSHQLGLIARTALREYFPGYSVYLWFDADAWAQTPEFFELMVDGARTHGMAVVRENGSGYRRHYIHTKWWYGHMILAYGLFNGVKIAVKPSVNIGVIAFADKGPHWDAWIRYYENLIAARGRANLDQHAFNAALELEQLPHALVPARCNWISILSTPRWSAEQRKLCEPNKNATPISVLHLAGPDKLRSYNIRQDGRPSIVTALTYSGITDLRRRS